MKPLKEYSNYIFKLCFNFRWCHLTKGEQHMKTLALASFPPSCRSFPRAVTVFMLPRP